MPGLIYMGFLNKQGIIEERLYKIKNGWGNSDAYCLILESDTQSNYTKTSLDFNASDYSDYFEYIGKEIVAISGELLDDHTFTGDPTAFEYCTLTNLSTSGNYKEGRVTQYVNTTKYSDVALTTNTISSMSNLALSGFFILIKYPNGKYTRLQLPNINDSSEVQTGLVYNKINNYPSSDKLGSIDLFVENDTHVFTQISGDAFTWIGDYIEDNYKPYDTKDPNKNLEPSTGGGGGGDGDIGGNPHKTGEIPSISALDSGLITLYSPSTEQLQALGKFLWSDSFDINSLKKLFNDPFDTLLGLSIVPIKPIISSTHNIIFGNLDSGVSSGVVANQWVPVDCGSFTLSEVWNGALDYQPSTQVSIYLPFIGVRQLNVNDVMGSTLHLYYKFDVLTGTCVAEITINHTGQNNKSSGFSYNSDMGSVYTFEGQCAVNIPLASQDFTNTIRAAIGAVGMVSGAAASFAAGHPALGTAALMMGTANAEIATHTPTIERSGHLSSSSALLSSLEPCLFVQRAHICKPERYYALRGVPSQVYVSALSNATGYFEIADIQNIHASGASDSELQEIKQLLTQGVFIDSWS